MTSAEDTFSERFWARVCEMMYPFYPIILIVHLLIGIGLVLAFPGLEPSSPGYVVAVLGGIEVVFSLIGFTYVFHRCRQRYVLDDFEFRPNGADDADERCRDE